jgi:hypothetical protein
LSSLVHRLSGPRYDLPRGLLRAWRRHLSRVLSDDGVGGLMDLVASLEKLVMADAQAQVIQRSSIFGKE